MISDKAWKECAAVLNASYSSSFRLNAFSLEVWYDALADLTDDELYAGVKAVVKTCEFPTIAAIRKAGLQYSGQDWESAWAWAMARAGSFFYCNPGKSGSWHDDPIQAELIGEAVREIGGAWAINHIESDYESRQLSFAFRNAYEGLLAERRRKQNLLNASSQIEIEPKPLPDNIRSAIAPMLKKDLGGSQ